MKRWLLIAALPATAWAYDVDISWPQKSAFPQAIRTGDSFAIAWTGNPSVAAGSVTRFAMAIPPGISRAWLQMVPAYDTVEPLQQSMGLIDRDNPWCSMPIRPSPTSCQGLAANDFVFASDLTTPSWTYSAFAYPVNYSGGLVSANTLARTTYFVLRNPVQVPFRWESLELRLWVDDVNTYNAWRTNTSNTSTPAACVKGTSFDLAMDTPSSIRTVPAVGGFTAAGGTQKIAKVAAGSSVSLSAGVEVPANYRGQTGDLFALIAWGNQWFARDGTSWTAWSGRITDAPTAARKLLTASEVLDLYSGALPCGSFTVLVGYRVPTSIGTAYGANLFDAIQLEVE